MCPLFAKKPITNPRSIKDFAITKHAFRKAGPGALGEFQPGVRPQNLLIVSVTFKIETQSKISINMKTESSNCQAL